MSDSENSSINSQSSIDKDANELLISIGICGSCSRDSSPTGSDVSDLTPCSSEENSPNSANSGKRVRTPRSSRSSNTETSEKSYHSSLDTLKSIQSSSSESSESIRSSESSESVKARQACVFMIETMLRVFPDSEKFFVNDDYDEDNFEESLIEFLVFKNKEGEEGDLCLNFYFDPDEIYIERALTSKCKDVTGTDLLNRMGMVFLILRDEYPEKNVKMKIRLDEAELQFLGIKRSLSWLYLFKSGKSWYNSKGYYEKNYLENKLLIDEFIHQKVVDEYEEDLAIISSILAPISDEETIQTLFIKVCDILKSNKEKCCQCIKLLNITITKFMDFLRKKPGNNFMCTKFYQLYYNPDYDPDSDSHSDSDSDSESEIVTYLRQMIDKLPPFTLGGGRKTRKRRVNKGKNNRSIKRKSNKKSMKRRKGKKTMKRRTKKNKRHMK